MSLAFHFVSEARASNTEVDLSGLNSQSEGTLTRHKAFSGSVGFNTSSFFYNSDVHGTSSTTIEAKLNGKSDTPVFHSEGNLQLYTFATQHPEFGVESRELFIQTQKGLLDQSQITFGRKVYEWSKLDKTWTMMSLWSPRWTWDELHPELVGMTGLFYTYDNSNFHFMAFGSPIAIPERGTPVTEKNGNIVSPNPLWKPLPRQLQLTANSNPVNVNYALDTPSLRQILMRPNFAIRGRYDFDSGFWVSLNSGVLPVNMVQMAAEPYAALSNSVNFHVNIKPQFPMRNINSAEAGYQSKDQSWDVWSSISYEQPFQYENQPTWLNPIIMPSTIVSAGTGVQLTSNFRFQGAALYINEQPFNNPNTTLSNVNVQLPTRFPVKQGIKMGGAWQFTEATESNLSWIQDLAEQNHFISMDVEHRFFSSNIIVGAGTDVLVASSNKGWVGQYYGDDRLRGWLKYAF